MPTDRWHRSNETTTVDFVVLSCLGSDVSLPLLSGIFQLQAPHLTHSKLSWFEPFQSDKKGQKGLECRRQKPARPGPTIEMGK